MKHSKILLKTYFRLVIIGIDRDGLMLFRTNSQEFQGSLLIGTFFTKCLIHDLLLVASGPSHQELYSDSRPNFKLCLLEKSYTADFFK